MQCSGTLAAEGRGGGNLRMAEAATRQLSACYSMLPFNIQKTLYGKGSQLILHELGAKDWEHNVERCRKAPTA